MVVLVWWAVALPFLTMSPFWVWTNHKAPLPIITTAQEETGDREMIWVSRMRVAGWFAGLAVW